MADGNSFLLALSAGLIRIGVSAESAPLVALCLLFVAVTSVAVAIILYALIGRLRRPAKGREVDSSGEGH